MLVTKLALCFILTTPVSDSVKVDLQQVEDSLVPEDTLPAIELADTAAFMEDNSGATHECLVEGYTCLRELLILTLKKGWSGEFTTEELAKRFSNVRKYDWLQSATFQLAPTRKAVYVSFMENEGFLPVIRLRQDREAGALFYEFQTSRGASIAVASLLAGF